MIPVLAKSQTTSSCIYASFSCVQANITQTPDKQPDQKYGLNSDIFNSPEGMMPFADTCTPERAIPSGGPGLEDFEVELTAIVVAVLTFGLLLFIGYFLSEFSS